MKNAQTNHLSSQSKSFKYSIKQQPAVYNIVQYHAKSFIQQMAYMLVRPPRFRYNKFLLSPSKKADNFIVENHRLSQFQLSLYLPKHHNVDYIILYLHGNSSSRLEGFLYLNMLPKNVGLACFDFNGCGNRNIQSQKQESNIIFLTLGKKESLQIDIAAKYLKSLGYKVVGWGRSMGAVSLLLSNQIQIMVVDSPYSSLIKLCEQSQQKVVPCYLKCIALCFFQCIFQKVKDKVFQLSGMKPQEMQIYNQINKNYQNRQICFIHGQNDELIKYQHSQSLYQAFEGRKQYILFQGNHNSNRTQQVIDACIQFIEQSFQVIELKQLQKKSKLMFVRQNNQRRISQRKIQALNSLKKKKKKLHLTNLQQTYKNMKQNLKQKQKQKTMSQYNNHIQIQIQPRLSNIHSNNFSTQPLQSETVGIQLFPLPENILALTNRNKQARQNNNCRHQNQNKSQSQKQKHTNLQCKFQHQDVQDQQYTYGERNNTSEIFKKRQQLDQDEDKQQQHIHIQSSHNDNAHSHHNCNHQNHRNHHHINDQQLQMGEFQVIDDDHHKPVNVNITTKTSQIAEQICDKQVSKA